MRSMQNFSCRAPSDASSLFVAVVASPFLASEPTGAAASPSGLTAAAGGSARLLSGPGSRRSDSLVWSSGSLPLWSSLFSGSRVASCCAPAVAVAVLLAPLSATADTDTDGFASDLATGGTSGLEGGSAVSGFAGLAGRFSLSYLASRGRFLFGAIVVREAESAGRTTDDDGAGEEFPDLASGASFGSGLWFVFSCLGGQGNCRVRPNSTSATSISS